MRDLKDVLRQIPAAELSYEEWLKVGMALKHEGYGCDVWDAWSQGDSRYKPGVCKAKWQSFREEAGAVVTGGTIVALAKKYGRYAANAEMDWNDVIEYDGSEPTTESTFDPAKWDGRQDMIRYLRTLFKPDDHVSYVCDTTDHDGRIGPGTGCWDRTAGELIDLLSKTDDVTDVIGTWSEEHGAWIRFNPVSPQPENGYSVGNKDVAAYRYALIECDGIPIAEQDVLYRRHELPIATLVHSGGKSLHAIVHIDAGSYPEYTARVKELYRYLTDHKVPFDPQNKNPSRLSRLPGVTRDGKPQYLVATNIGRRDWADWQDWVEDQSDPLPPISTLAEYVDNPPDLLPVQIEGILRRGHKMLIAGPSKAGKSYLLMALAICVAEGRKWLGTFACTQGQVLYVNLEIDGNSAIRRLLDIYKALGIEPRNARNIKLWNLRGKALPMDKLAPKIIRRLNNGNRDINMVIIDPIYKVITGDENNASEMGQFCNQFDKICAEAGCSVVYCHHHSKGAQGNKRAMDRASGSGVFARDPDAQLDLVELVLSDELRNTCADAADSTAWRLESSLREFKNIKPLDLWFNHPIHEPDHSGDLKKCGAAGSIEAARTQNPNNKLGDDDRAELLRNAYTAQKVGDTPVSVADIAEYIGKTEKSVREWLKKFNNEWGIKDGYVYAKHTEET